MGDVNEEILVQYLKIVKKWFYIEDIAFTVPYNYSNIDVLAFDKRSNTCYDFEVKFRSAYSLTNNDTDYEYLVEQFDKYKEERERKIKEYFSGSKIIKVILTTYKMLGISSEKRGKMEKRFSDEMERRGYKSQIWYFDEIIPELFSEINPSGRYNTQLLQTLRMLKTFNFKQGD